jgi:CDP-2,3-bis-(O-geranylgeranyl)-sn-glycerol synthase
MVELTLQVIWFLIPPGVANLVPPIFAKLLPKWNYPMDFGLTIRSQRLFGSHKTFRGLISGILTAIAVHNIQILLASRYQWIENLAIDDVYYQHWWLGAWLGFTALGGDAIKSMIKRQANLEPGKPWLPWDKIDWILGTLAGTWFIFQFSTLFIIIAIVAGLVLSFTGRVIGYWLGINSSWI